MRRCHLCGGILWPFPWSHFAFSGRGKIRWHVRCYQQVKRIFQEDADQWERVARDGGV